MDNDSIFMINQGINKANNSNNVRDICRGILLLLLLLGSVDTIPIKLKLIIYSVHLPLMFVLEGMSIDNYDIRDNLEYIVKKLIKPYLIVAVISSALSALLYTGDINSAGATFLFSLDDYVVGLSNPSTICSQYDPVGLVWIILCIAVSRIVYILLRNKLDRHYRWTIIPIIIILTLIGIYTSSKVGFLPWSIDVALACLPFVAAGDMLGKTNKDLKGVLLLGGVAFVTWGVLLKNYILIDITARRYPYTVLCFICAIAGSYTIVVISNLLEKISIISKMMAFLGKTFMLGFVILCLEIRFLNWDSWVYQPLNLNPGWILSFVLSSVFLFILSAFGLLIHNGLSKVSDYLTKNDKSTGDKVRIDWPDVAKGICMLSIILGHSSIDWINQLVFLYDLPVFFLIAGFFLKKDEEYTFIKNKARRLLIPYYLTCFGICIGKAIIAAANGTSVSQAVKERILAALYAAGDSWQEPNVIYGIGAIWFLWALFLALIIVNHFVERKYYGIIIACIAYVGWASFEKTGIWLPLSVQAAMFATAYIIIGYECRKTDYNPAKIGKVPLICLVFVAAFGIQHFRGFWIVHDYMGNGWLDFFISLAASSLIIAIAVDICKKHIVLRNILRFIGQHSLVVLCFHTLEMEAIPLGDLNLKITSLMSMNPLFSVLTFLLIKISFSVLATVLFVIVKNRLNFARISVNSKEI